MEEAKLISKNIKEIGSLRLSIGFLDEQCTIFLARNVASVIQSEDTEHEIELTKKFSLNKALLMIKENKITDGLTVAAILKAKTILHL